MSTQTLQPLTIPSSLAPRDTVLVRLDVVTATAAAVLVRLPGGWRETWLPVSQVREVMPLRAGAERTYRVPCWLAKRLKLELE
jgi:hypothetical protein